LSYRGLGEVAIWFSCGWLATIMGYYLQTGRLDTVAILASFPGAFSVFLVILINERPDMQSDAIAGKKNLVVRLGKERAIYLYIAMLVFTYLFMIAIAFFGVPLITAPLSVILLPFVVWNIISLIRKGSLENTKAMEAVSLRTMLLDHLITFIYIAAFIAAGLSLAGAQRSDLIIIAILCVLVLGLEGLSVACSKSIRGK
jgi:1,4-dihydroxy-2-naphthoate octaprenyltransferase